MYSRQFTLHVVSCAEVYGGKHSGLYLLSGFVQDLLANKKLPLVDTVQMSDLLHYLFTSAEKTLRIQVAEVVYRNDHDHPNALDVFPACTLPLAEKAARRRAQKLDNLRQLMR